jgi:hypothetical protein
MVSVTSRLLYHRGKSPQHPLGRRMDGSQTFLDEVEKIEYLALLGLELHPTVFQTVASRYTD